MDRRRFSATAVTWVSDFGHCLAEQHSSRHVPYARKFLAVAYALPWLAPN